MIRRSSRLVRAAALAAAAFALTILTVAAPRPSPAAPAPRRFPAAAALEGRLSAALGEGRIGDAEAAADSLVAVRQRAPGASPTTQSALLDSLGRRFIQSQTPEGWTAAGKLFRGALERRERALGGEHPDVARSLSAIAAVLDHQGRWAEAVPLAERALAIRTRARGERQPETAASLRQVGLLHFQLGDYAAAGPPLSRSVEIYAALGAGQEQRLADGLNNLGELARVRDRFEEAEGHFLRGLGAARALPPDHALRIALSNNLAGLYKDLGRYDDAAPLLERVVSLEEAGGADDEALATDHLNLAEIYRLQGRALEAAPLYARALAGARRGLPAGHPDLVPFLNQAAVSAQELGRTASAESLFLETRAIVEQALGPSHPLLAQNLNDLGGLYLATGRPAQAESAYRQALELREKSFGPSHPEVALTLVDLTRARSRSPGGSAPVALLLARAIAILDSSRAYPEARLDAYALRAEWHAAQGRRRAAIDDMATALAAVDTLRSRRGGGDETRAAYLARRLALFDRMLGWLLAEGETERALETHERARARMLLDQIAAGGVDFRAGLPPDLYEPLERAASAAEGRLASAQQRLQGVRADATLGARERMETIAALEAARDSAAFDLEGARGRIRDASPLWRSLLSADGRIPTARELQRGLVPRGGVMLVYHVGAEASYVFAVPASGRPRARPLVVDAEAAAALGVAPGPLTTERLERIVTGVRSAAAPDSALGIAELLGGSQEGGAVFLAHRSRERPDSLELRLHALWRLLVPAPLWPRVRAARTAIVLPDGALHLVPFEALVTRTRWDSPRTRYWLDEGPALSYGVSATSLWSLARRAPRAAPSPADGAPVLSVTDVAFALAAGGVSADPSRGGADGLRGETWSPLPQTLRETAAICSAFAPRPVTIITGQDAREPAVRSALPGRRYLHLATHGFVTESRSHLLAGLVLAPSPDSLPGADDDGVLQLYEIYGLRLACELAVLSACETHRGPRVAGEGAFALSRAFHAAGARRVVASLWAVNDEPTATLVGGLFEAVARAERRGGATAVARVGATAVAIGLRDAKRSLRDDPRWSDVFYWAPFVLSGP